MHFTLRTFIGRPMKNSWTQFWENEPDDITINSKRGHLFGLINFDVKEDTDISSLGHELIAEINQYYYSSVDDDVPLRLKSVLADFVSGLDFQFSNISLILAVVLNDQLYLAILNGGYCILQRGTAISSLLTGEVGVKIISGSLINNDRILLCTSKFFTAITWENIKKNLSLTQIQDIEENFLAQLYHQDDQHGLAGVFIKVNNDMVTLDKDNSQQTDNIPPEKSNSPPSIPRRESKNIFHKLFPRRSVYITHHENAFLSRRKKLNIIFSIIILIALSVSVVISSRQNEIKQTEKKYQDLKSQVETKLNNAKTVQKINLNSALAAGKEASALINEMTKLNIHTTEVNQLRQEITTLLSQSGSAADYTPEMYFDTTIIGNNLNYTQLFSAKDSLYLLDSQNGRIDLFNLSNQSTNSISLADTIKGSISFALNNDKVYLLNNNQIYEVQKNNLISQIDIIKQTPDFTEGQIQFWNGSLYLLSLTSQANAVIWKFTPSASGFSPGQIWLKDKQSLPIDTTSFAINGKVWVLSQNGTIAPYSLGSREDFKMSASDNLEKAKNITTSPDAEILAFVSGNSLVHIYQKDGQSPKLFNLGDRKISSIALDQAGKSVYVLCQDQKIYKITL